MMEQKKGKLHRFQAKRRKLNIARLGGVALILIVAVYFVSCGIRIVNLKSEKEQVEAENERLKETVENLTQELESIDSDQFYERLARKNLKLVKGNELLFVLPSFRAIQEEDAATGTDGRDPKEKQEEKESGTDEAKN